MELVEWVCLMERPIASEMVRVIEMCVEKSVRKMTICIRRFWGNGSSFRSGMSI